MIGIMLWALMITNQTQDINEDRLIAVYATKEHCQHEAKLIIESGPSAYCVPTTKSSPGEAEDQIKAVAALIGNNLRNIYDLSRN